MCVCTHIYIYIYTHVYTYIYIYIERERDIAPIAALPCCTLKQKARWQRRDANRAQFPYSDELTNNIMIMCIYIYIYIYNTNHYNMYIYT